MTATTTSPRIYTVCRADNREACQIANDPNYLKEAARTALAQARKG